MRMYAPSPTVTAPPVPLYQSGRSMLKGLGQDESFYDDSSFYDYSGDYSDPGYYDYGSDPSAYSDPGYYVGPYSPEYYDTGQAYDLAAQPGQYLDTVVGDTGFTVAEMLDAGFSQEEIDYYSQQGESPSYDPSTGIMTMPDGTQIDVGAAQPSTVPIAPGIPQIPYVPVPSSPGSTPARTPTPAPGGGGSSVAIPTSGSKPTTQQQPTSPAPKVPSTPVSANWFGQSSLISGVPNWAVAGGGGLLLLAVLQGRR